MDDAAHVADEFNQNSNSSSFKQTLSRRSSGVGGVASIGSSRGGMTRQSPKLTQTAVEHSRI